MATGAGTNRGFFRTFRGFHRHQPAAHHYPLYPRYERLSLGLIGCSGWISRVRPECQCSEGAACGKKKICQHDDEVGPPFANRPSSIMPENARLFLDKPGFFKDVCAAKVPAHVQSLPSASNFLPARSTNSSRRASESASSWGNTSRPISAVAHSWYLSKGSFLIRQCQGGCYYVSLPSCFFTS